MVILYFNIFYFFIKIIENIDFSFSYNFLVYSKIMDILMMYCIYKVFCQCRAWTGTTRSLACRAGPSFSYLGMAHPEIILYRDGPKKVSPKYNGPRPCRHGMA